GLGPLARDCAGSKRRVGGGEDEAGRDEAVGVRSEGLRVLRQIGDRSHVVRLGNGPNTKRIVPGTSSSSGFYACKSILNSDGVDGENPRHTSAQPVVCRIAKSAL